MKKVQRYFTNVSSAPLPRSFMLPANTLCSCRSIPFFLICHHAIVLSLSNSYLLSKHVCHKYIR
jgi:hypothetical protein